MSEERPEGALLVGLIEIAQYAGVTTAAVSNWRTRDETFPEPVASLHCGGIFWLPEVHDWLVATGRPTNQGWTFEQAARHDAANRNKRRSTT